MSKKETKRKKGEKNGDIPNIVLGKTFENQKKRLKIY